jgi:hypothetical protein
MGVQKFENPPFLARFPELAKTFALTETGGLTLGCVVLIRMDIAADPHEFPHVLVHELVHVTQWQYLGFNRFIERYVREGVTEAANAEPDRRSMPLEPIAYAIEAEHRAQTLPPGDVVLRVLAQL